MAGYVLNSRQWIMFTPYGVIKILGSKQMRSVPFFFVTATIELIQSVGSVTGVMIPCCARCSRVCFSLSLIATGTRLGHAAQVHNTNVVLAL